MLELPGYQITEEIKTGISTSTYRGYDEQEQKSVIVKVLSSEYPTLEEIARLRQEYTIPQSLDCQGIVKPYSLHFN